MAREDIAIIPASDQHIPIRRILRRSCPPFGDRSSSNCESLRRQWFGCERERATADLSRYTDYLMQYRGTPALVIEAKRVGKLPLDTADLKLGQYKIDGPALNPSAMVLLRQPTTAVEHGVEFATLTSGTVWIAFMALRSRGKSFREYKAIVFPSLASIESEFATFYELFSKEGVSQKVDRTHFAKLDGVSAAAFEPANAGTPARSPLTLPRRPSSPSRPRRPSSRSARVRAG